MNTIFQEATEAVPRSAQGADGDIVDECFVRTAEALKSTGAASESDILKALNSVREAQTRGEPMDLIETLARILGHDEERIGTAIMDLSDAVASTMNPVPPTISFASKLIAPSAFYDSFDAIHKLGKLMLTPVVYAEDTDAIGTASINPIAAHMLGEEIHATVGKRFGIRPFITVARMEYESWAFLCRKHFEL
jgi:hypothetical protein